MEGSHGGPRWGTGTRSQRFIERHYGRIYRVGARVLGDADEAADLAQDVCVALPGPARFLARGEPVHDLALPGGGETRRAIRSGARTRGRRSERSFAETEALMRIEGRIASLADMRSVVAAPGPSANCRRTCGSPCFSCSRRSSGTRKRAKSSAYPNRRFPGACTRCASACGPSPRAGRRGHRDRRTREAGLGASRHFAAAAGAGPRAGGRGRDGGIRAPPPRNSRRGASEGAGAETRQRPG